MARKKKTEEVIKIAPKLEDSIPEIVELDQIKSEDLKKVPEAEPEEELHGQFNNVEPMRPPRLRPLRRL